MFLPNKKAKWLMSILIILIFANVCIRTRDLPWRKRCCHQRPFWAPRTEVYFGSKYCTSGTLLCAPQNTDRPAPASHDSSPGPSRTRWKQRCTYVEIWIITYVLKSCLIISVKKTICALPSTKAFLSYCNVFLHVKLLFNHQLFFQKLEITLIVDFLQKSHTSVLIAISSHTLNDLYYRTPTKLWEDNAFSHVCLSLCSQTGGDPCTGPNPSIPDLFILDLTVQGSPGHVQTCSTWTSLYRDPPDMFKLVHWHGLSAIGWLALDWNDFLLRRLIHISND